MTSHWKQEGLKISSQTLETSPLYLVFGLGGSSSFYSCGFSDLPPWDDSTVYVALVHVCDGDNQISYKGFSVGMNCWIKDPRLKEEDLA